MSYSVKIGATGGIGGSGGTTVSIKARSLRITKAAGRRSMSQFTIYDATGTHFYAQNTQVSIYDDNGVLQFSGYVDQPKLYKPGWKTGGLLYTEMTCKDQHYLADKRLVAKTYNGSTADQIINDIVTNVLSAEGVITTQNLLSLNQSNAETGTTGFTTPHSEVLAQTSTQAWQGTHSISVTTPGSVAFEGVAVMIASTNFTNGQAIAISAWVYAPLGQAMRLMLWQLSPSVNVNSVNFTGTGAWQRVTLAHALPNPLVATNYGIRVDTATTAAITFYVDGCQIEPIGVANSWLPGGTSSVAVGPVITEVIFNYVSCAAAFDEVATRANDWWAIDENKILWFQPAGALAAPWNFDGTMAENDQTPVTVENYTAKYRNKQYIKGGLELTSSQTETRKGDGVTRAWPMRYDMSKTAPTITLNGTGKTVGIKGKDTGKDYYYAQGDSVIAQDAAGTLLISTDTLSVTYIGQYDIVAASEDDGQITTQAALDGTTGIVEQAITDPRQSSSATSFEYAAALLLRYGVQAIKVTYMTRQTGLQPGQVQTLTYAPMGLTGQLGFIEQITLDDSRDGVTVWQTVEAITGAYDDNYVSFWKAIMNQVPQDPLANDATTAIIVTTESWTLTLPALTLVWTPTVYACPLPSSTLYPSTSLLPC